VVTLDYHSNTPPPRTVVTASIHLLVWSIMFLFCALIIAAIAVIATVSNLWEGETVSSLLGLVLFGGFAFLLGRTGFNFLKVRAAMFRGHFHELHSNSTAFGFLAFVLGGAALVLLLIFLDRNNTGVPWLTVISAAICLAGAICAVWTGFAVKKALAELKNRTESV
jgi:hypothetical protein